MNIQSSNLPVRSWLPVAILFLLMLAHLPFMSADPDFFISDSRGPFTDEGLNTIQVRNYVNHGYLSLTECDNLLKTPLFGLSLYLPYEIFGTKLLVSRWIVLLMIVIPLMLLASKKKYRIIILVFTLIGLFLYPVFQFSHFSLAEMLSTVCILLSLFFFEKSITSAKTNNRSFVYAILLISAAYYFKVQFIYIIVLLPLAALINYFFSGRKILKRRTIWLIAGGLILMAGIYFISWYLPYRREYNFMMEHQSGNLIFGPDTWLYFTYHLKMHFLKGNMLAFSLVFLLSLVTGIVIYFRQPQRKYTALFSGALAWFLLEMHKFPLEYLPTRYIISLYASMGFLISIIMAEVISGGQLQTSGGKYLRTLAIALTGLLFIINLNNYRITYNRRTFNIQEVNDYLGDYNFGEQPVLGAWAPSLTWKCKARAIPVWNGFLNFQDPLRRFDPVMVISEPEQQDSEQAYLKQGIDLAAESDSINSASIGKWQVYLYWIKHSID